MPVSDTFVILIFLYGFYTLSKNFVTMVFYYVFGRGHSYSKQIITGNVFDGNVQIVNGETTDDGRRRTVVKLKNCQKEDCKGCVTSSKQFNIYTVHGGKRRVNITCNICGEYELEI